MKIGKCPKCHQPTGDNRKALWTGETVESHALGVNKNICSLCGGLVGDEHNIDRDPESKKWKTNYKYQITSTIQVEGRESYIKSLRAVALYMEEECSDEQFHELAMGQKKMPVIDTYKLKNMEYL